MIQTKTHKVKVWDHDDAVVYVYESRWEYTDKGCNKYRHWNHLITAIPLNFGYEDDLTQADIIAKIQEVVDALYAVYALNTDGNEINISYLINNLRCINC
jgi:hypothetical protein